ncbi:MarR family winged helix-turn-helix transcriptional regulator [Kordiimonas pumila]|uniref:MarR family winged helix-turn-helix transcriptional regulator n=1 Tax=Kordiimonas pumila TaxID=2161677 RepID=A0ABV7D4Q2_9PROT|nr:MarR family winged helix-turn-helix transcriptional regulator [Kordiimonas pumila]
MPQAKLTPNDMPHATIEDEHFDLEAWPFYWLSKAHGQYFAKLENALREVELDIPRWRVLMLLEPERARSVSYLASGAIIKVSTMTRIVQRMQEEGLVITRPRETDARVTEVLLTGNGRRARTLAWQKANGIFTHTFKDIPLDTITTLNDTLGVIVKNLEELP